MMKRFILAAALFLTTPAFATPERNETLYASVPSVQAPKPPKVYRPFRYETACQLTTNNQTFDDVCVVIETRETGGALRTRNIYSNKFKLTIKGRFDKVQGYMTWDNYNQREYKWDYMSAGSGWTYVMPGVLLQNVSWD